MIEVFAKILENFTGLPAEIVSDFTRTGEKMQTLKNEIQDLENRQTDVLVKLKDEEIRSGKKRKREVKNWLADVTEKKRNYESLDNEVQQTRYYHFPSRLRLEKRIKEMRSELERLAEISKFPDGYFLDVCNTKGKPLLTMESDALDTFTRNLTTVWDFLMNDVEFQIGIYGMGGVGKTNLAMHIHNKLLNDSTLNGNVFWVTVSQDSNISKLQNDLAAALDQDLSSTTYVEQRAALLFDAFMRRKRYVLILDDVWDNVELEKIGVPLVRDGSKLLVTSRSRDVCCKIGCHKNIKVEVLSEKEAWELFLEKLSHGVKRVQLSPEIEKIAKKVAKRCGGLPFAIITMARSMRSAADVMEWRDALEELKDSSMKLDDMENEVFPVLCNSFNRLKDPELQHCFLYCCLYSEDDEIRRDELITQLLVGELVHERKSREAGFDHGHVILNKLERASLLERVDDDRVKVHNLIRDMALKISQNNTKIMVKSRMMLDEVPKDREWKEELSIVSLMDNTITWKSPSISPNCQRLSTLILRRSLFSNNEIPDSFFVHMHALKVLDLSETLIKKLPNSISALENLNALFLCCCVLLEFVPPLTKLKALKELNLSESGITELPSGVQNLVNLKCLDMRDMRSLKIMPKGILPTLALLQRLVTPYHIPICAEELEGLKHLEEFEGSFVDIRSFFKSRIKLSKLKFYVITIGDPIYGWSGMRSKKLISKSVTVVRHCFSSAEGGGEIKVMLPHDIQQLQVRECNCTELEHVMGLVEGENDCHVPLQSPYGKFAFLKVFRIESCNKMKRLFTLRMLGCLYNLEEVHVRNGYDMEDIIWDEEECSPSFSTSYKDQVVAFPKLRLLCLWGLPKLKNIYIGKLICDSIEEIEVVGCYYLRRLPFFLSRVNGQPSRHASIKISSTRYKEWWKPSELDYLSDTSILQPRYEYAVVKM